LTKTCLASGLYDAKDLSKTLTLLSDKLLEVEVRKTNVMENVDDLERWIEGMQFGISGIIHLIQFKRISCFVQVNSVIAVGMPHTETHELKP